MLYDSLKRSLSDPQRAITTDPMLKSPTLQFDMMYISSCSDDDDEESSMSTDRTMSSISISPSSTHHPQHKLKLTTSPTGDYYHRQPSTETPYSVRSSSLSMSFFQHAMETDPHASVSKNTYFMDGGNRFISVPMLGNTNTKAGSSISRLFEEWLADKLYCQPEPASSMQTDMDDRFVIEQRLPILQDHVELVAEDILNKMKSSAYSWQRKGLDKIMIKVRTGHVYTYHSLEDGQPLITQGMEELFQQFPLFVEFFVYTTRSSSSSSPSSSSTTQLLLLVENVTINPGNPYKIMEEF